MKCFEVIQTVLDATYEEVPDEGGRRDKRIAAAIESIADQYKNKLMAEGGPDFDDASARFGYVYKYVPAHAHWLYDLMTERKEVQEVLETGRARITCIGGGPGSEIVGVLKYLDEYEIDCKLFCELIDYCEGWKSTWGDLAFQLDWESSLHTDYIIHDAGDRESWHSPTKIDKADIIILNFFVSEIYHLDSAEDYLNGMLGRAKSGALLLVNDNRTQAIYKLIDDIARKEKYRILFEDEGTKKIYDPGEQKSALKKYEDKFGASSKLTHNMFRRIYQKK